MIKEVIETAFELKQYPEFYEATVKETYEIALRVVELERLDTIHKQLNSIDVSLNYIN